MNSIVKSIQKLPGSQCNEASSGVMRSISIRQSIQKNSCHILNHWSWEKVRYTDITELILLFSKDALKWPKVTVKTYIMLLLKNAVLSNMPLKKRICCCGLFPSCCANFIVFGDFIVLWQFCCVAACFCCVVKRYKTFSTFEHSWADS